MNNAVSPTESSEFDFSGLDDLLAEASQRQQAVEAGKVAQRKILRGGLRSDDHAEALFAVRAAEVLTTWEFVDNLAVKKDSACLVCGSSTYEFLGFFELRRHLRDKGSKQVLRLTDRPNSYSIYTVHSIITECAHCITGNSVNPAVLAEFTVLTKFGSAA